MLIAVTSPHFCRPGVVTKMKMQRTIVIRRDYLHYIRKYNRFEKRHKNMSVHLSPCFRCVQVPAVTGGSVATWRGGVWRCQRRSQCPIHVFIYTVYSAELGFSVEPAVLTLSVHVSVARAVLLPLLTWNLLTGGDV